MLTQPDFEDFLRLLESHRVDYMIIGGDAVGMTRFICKIPSVVPPAARIAQAR